MNAVADSKDTMMALLQGFILIDSRHMQWLVVEGDAKLYDILKSYGKDLK